MARGKIGQGNILIHGRKRPRYRCKECGRTFSAQVEMMFAGLRNPTDLIVIVATLPSYGCPLQAIVHAYGLDERTVASWRLYRDSSPQKPIILYTHRHRDAVDRAPTTAPSRPGVSLARP